MGSLLSATDRTRVEQKFLQFSIQHFDSNGATLISHDVALRDVRWRGQIASRDYFRAVRTRFRNGGQSSMVATISSPSPSGPTPEGVPVRMTSPGSNVRL